MQDDDFSNLGLAKTVVLPALLVFLIPAIAFGVFSFAQSSYDAEALAFVIDMIQTDATLSEADKALAIEEFTATPYSSLITDPEVAAGADSTIVRHYAIFRWMIWLSGGSIAFGLLAFALAGLSVAASRRSQQAQYISLNVAWHTLRAYAAAQVVIQGVLLVALSFWVTALTLNVYSVKLVFITGALAVMACFAMLKAMWVKLDDDFSIAGAVIHRDEDAPFWEDIDAICAKVGTAAPDQLIAGIDDNFFVTEHPITVDGTTHTGRTLYVSLSLLKQLDGAEADAVIAHEMAHFSGQDTTYSKKISPLLGRYAHYLQALADGGITLPIYYFMLCFRTLFELSLRSLSRDREFRADRVAAEATSADAMAGALLRIAAYSTYRGTVENDLFKQEEALENANIAEQIEGGFPSYALQFASEDSLGEVATSHPFDTHPKMAQRLEAVGVSIAIDSTKALLADAGDGRWFGRIPQAEELERSQWDAYEKRFRDYHEEVLAWRYLPSNEAETELVLKFFPAALFGVLELSYTGLNSSTWDEPIAFSEITGLTINDSDALVISYPGGASKFIPMNSFGGQRDLFLAELDRYNGRHHSAIAYQQQAL